MDVPKEPAKEGTAGSRPAPGRPTYTPVADPVLAVPPPILSRYGARILDPATAVKVAGQGEVRSTVYISDKLIVGGAANDDTREALTRAAESKGLTLVPPIVHTDRRQRLTPPPPPPRPHAAHP